jgi:hypothetical protein
VWEIEIDLKLVKGKIGKDDVPREVVSSFVDQLEKAWSAASGSIDGILLVIDEIDRIAEEPGVATFFKVATEMMTARGLESIVLLPVGMVGVQELLKAEHASVGRVFELIHVPKLSKGESIEIIERAIEQTNVTIDDGVCEEIARLADGFPHPIHLLGFECFEIDRDDHIDADDLAEALHVIVIEKWKEEFDASYVEAGSGKNREIIKAMADYSGADVPLSYICERLGVEQPEISSNINTLMTRNVIVRPDRGIYRFRDPLFRVYVGKLNVLGEEPVEQRPRKRKRPQSGATR